MGAKQLKRRKTSEVKKNTTLHSIESEENPEFCLNGSLQYVLRWGRHPAWISGEREGLAVPLALLRPHHVGPSAEGEWHGGKWVKLREGRENVGEGHEGKTDGNEKKGNAIIMKKAVENLMKRERAWTKRKSSWRVIKKVRKKRRGGWKKKKREKPNIQIPEQGF